MIKSIKIRIYPTKAQISIFEKYFGYSRYSYNNFLELWNIMYKNNEKPNFRKVRNKYKSILKLLSNLEEYSWIKEYSPQVVDTSGEDVERAWKNFLIHVCKIK